MILEALVTTVDSTGAMHVAPMGPRIDAEMKSFLLRPFPTSQTYRNLLAHREGVLHVSDDVLLLARAAIGCVTVPPPHQPAQLVKGFILSDACRAYEFRVKSIDDAEQRVRINCDVVRVQRMRDFVGFNRARNAVVEAAILATRVHLLPKAEISAEFAKLAVIVGKTGDAAEQEALTLLQTYVANASPAGSAP
jgi:uncharacterized protein